jgi:VanZ family protein
MRVGRAASLAIAALLYAVGLALITLSPLTEWHFVPEAPWGFLSQPWPKYWTGFDVLVNVLAYIPLGLLASRAVLYRVRDSAWGPLLSFVVAALACMLISILLEGLQTYLPSRRPSILDVASNAAGAMAGAFIASAYAQSITRLQITETRPIEIGGLALLGLWLIAQAAPQQIWLALGDIGLGDELRRAAAWITGTSAASPSVAQEVFAAQRILAEALCVGAAITSCALILHLTMLESSRWFARYRPEFWPRTLLAVVLATLAVRAGWVWLLSPAAITSWLTAGAQAGCGLAVTLMLANTLPENEFIASSISDWSRGRWLNLQLLANLSAMIWPFLALAWLQLVLSRRSVRALERTYGRQALPSNATDRSI